MALLPGYKGLGGSARLVLEKSTGKILTRRHYAEHIKRGNITNEELAQLNRAANPIASISRPARGRKSIQKLSPEFRETVAKARLEFEAEKQARIAESKKEAKLERDINRLLGHQIVRVPKFSGRLLKHGTQARRIAFNDYEEFAVLLNDAKKSGKVFSYGLGVEGIDTRSEATKPKLISMTVFKLRHINMETSQDEFDERMEETVEQKVSYFLLLHYWVHFHFTKSYIDEKNGKR